MKIFNKKLELENYLEPYIFGKKTIGFVPTMGALHNGHLSLIKKSLNENEISVISIFVNPTQFNNIEDLEKYPRTLEADIEKIKSVSEDIIIFAPTAEDIYDGNISSEVFDFEGIDKVMEGAFRPGHFDGVGTIVKKLLEIVRPTNAYFGEKDYQQILIIKSMVKQAKISVNIIPCPIIREANGLAMSSRNERLSPEKRAQADIIYKALQDAKSLFPTHSIAEIEKEIKQKFNKNNDFQLEYFTIVDAEKLELANEKEANSNYRAFIAVYVDGVRLIDNIALN
ncbi:MAG: pantoate--beta-alanine ligase [Capnocytophaga sp.]|nr:pantoate--beta-alanine ligase [Capnocytophaga sp.]